MSQLFLLVYHFQYVDLVPYAIFVGLLFFIMTLEVKVQLRVALMTLVILLFTCLRYDIGYDYAAYKKIAEGLNTDEFDRIELFDQALLQISMLINQYQFFFIVSSILTYIPLAWFCLKHSKDPELSLLVYVFYPFMFLESLSVIRNYIAYSVVLIALSMIIQRRFWWAVFWIAIAFGFHQSSVFALLLIPFYKIRLKTVVIWSMWIASFLLTMVLEKFLANFQSDNPLLALFLRYIEAKYQGGQIFTYLVNAICLVVLLLWSKLKLLKEENEGLMRLFFIGVCVWNVLAFDIVTRSRLSMYFMLTLLLIVPELKEVITIKGTQIRTCLIALLFAFFSSSFFINIKANLADGIKISYLPYQTIFSHVDYDRNE